MAEAEQTLFKNALTTIFANKDFKGDGYKYKDVFITDENRAKIFEEEIRNGIAAKLNKLETARAALAADRAAFETKMEEDRAALTKRRDELETDIRTQQAQIDEERAKIQDEIRTGIESGIASEIAQLSNFRKDILAKHIASQLEARLNADRAADENRQLEEALDKCKTDLVEETAKNAGLEAENAELKTRLDTLTNNKNVDDALAKQINVLTNANRNLTEQNATLTAENVAIKSELDKCSADNSELQNVIEKYKTENGELNTKLQKCDADNQQLKLNLQQLENAFQQHLQESRKEYVEAFLKIEAYKQHIEHMNRELAVLQDANTKLQDELRQLQDELGTLQATNQQLTNDLDALRTTNTNTITSANAKLSQDLDNCKKELTDLQIRYKALLEQSIDKNIQYVLLTDTYNSTVTSYENDINALNAEIVGLEKANKDCFEEVLKLKIEIEHYRKNGGNSDNYKREYIEWFLKATALKQALLQNQFEHKVALQLQQAANNDLLSKFSVEDNIQSKLNIKLLQKRIQLNQQQYETELENLKKTNLEQQINNLLQLDHQQLMYEGKLNAIKPIYPNTTVEMLHHKQGIV